MHGLWNGCCGTFDFTYVADLAKELNVSEDMFKDKEFPWEYISDEGLVDEVSDFAYHVSDDSDFLEFFLPYINFKSDVEPLATYESHYMQRNLGDYNRLEISSVLEMKKQNQKTGERKKDHELIFDTSTSVQIGEIDLESDENTLESILHETGTFYEYIPSFFKNHNLSVLITNKINIVLYDTQKRAPVRYRCESLRDGISKSSFSPDYEIVKKTLLGNT